MTAPPPSARRVAIALLRLLEADDRTAACRLVRLLSAEELRAVLLAQSENATLIFESVFGEVREGALPGISERFGRTRAEVIDDHLERLVLGLAREEAERA